VNITFSPIAPIQPAGVSPSAPRTGQPGSFQSLLENTIRQVEGVRQDADQATAHFLSGEQEDLHTVALATQRAELAFDMFLQVRNKVVQAYQEVMRMQL
jgi:flagellar hook-basal body complex protein FliE